MPGSRRVPVRPRRLWTFSRDRLCLSNGGGAVGVAFGLLFSSTGLLAFAAFGWSLMSVVNVTNALIQTHVPDELRGRVMGVYILLFQGGTPIGALFAGGLAGNISEATTVLIFASIILIVALTIHLRQPSIRKYN